MVIRKGKGKGKGKEKGKGKQHKTTAVVLRRCGGSCGRRVVML